jgi:hypothetical protein
MAISGYVGADGKPSPWFPIYEGSLKALSGFCLRLRLGPQSRALKQSKKMAAPVSAYERLALDDDDTDTAN